MIEQKQVLSHTLRDVLPEAAQQLYIKVYEQSWDQYDPQRDGPTTREAVASRDAWNAVTREFVQDDATHKWHRKGETVTAPVAQKNRGAMGLLKGIFKRSM
ncbi:MAG: ChaB family protein [Chloroflexi bacterium]|nr:ChaB family protein [Chloroflexota bacterium]